MTRQRLSQAEIDQRVQRLPGWSVQNDRLEKKYQFRDFVTAFGWMTRIALIAEKKDHHPDWKNTYNRVEVTLWTHDRGGLTANDFELAEAMNAAAEGLETPQAN